MPSDEMMMYYQADITDQRIREAFNPSMDILPTSPELETILWLLHQRLQRLEKLAEPVKVRVERPKTLEQESGLTEPPQDMESPIKVNLSGVGTDSMTPQTQPSLQSDQGTMTQSHVEQVLKCVHQWHKVMWEPEWNILSLPISVQYPMDHLERCLQWCQKCGALKYYDETHAQVVKIPN